MCNLLLHRKRQFKQLDKCVGIAIQNINKEKKMFILQAINSIGLKYMDIIIIKKMQR